MPGLLKRLVLVSACGLLMLVGLCGLLIVWIGLSMEIGPNAGYAGPPYGIMISTIPIPDDDIKEIEVTASWGRETVSYNITDISPAFQDSDYRPVYVPEGSGLFITLKIVMVSGATKWDGFSAGDTIGVASMVVRPEPEDPF